MALARYADDSLGGSSTAWGTGAPPAVVWLRGEHDASTVARLAATVARAISLDDADLVVDLSGLDFMDAAAAGVITRARDFLSVRSRSLVLRSPSARARRILDACGLGELVEPPYAHGAPLERRSAPPAIPHRRRGP